MAPKSIIGLTGGIGSGKSAAARHFSDHGVSVVDADQASREVVKKGEPALSSISDYFGEEILNKDGSLDRSKLRVIVFKDEKNDHTSKHFLAMGMMDGMIKIYSLDP